MIFNLHRYLLLTGLCLTSLSTGCTQTDPSAEPPLRNPYSNEQRHTVDRLLFNELNVRNRGWEGRTTEMRYAMVKAMSDEGYELAELTLRLFNFRVEDWDMPFDRKALRRLRVLADQGDASAQCLYAKAGRKWRKLTNKKHRKYVSLAAAQDHPMCLMHRGSLLRDQGRLEDALAMYHKAARLGNHKMQLYLVADYAKGKHGFPLDLGKANCWYEIAKRPEFDTGEAAIHSPRLNYWTRKAKEKGVRQYDNYDPNTWCQATTGDVTVLPD